MKYEFYDQVGNLVGLSEDPDGTPIRRDEEITNQLKGETTSRWKVIAVADPVGRAQRVTVRPI